MKKKYTLKRNTYAWLYPWIISILLIQSAALFSSTGPNRNNDRNHHIICFNVYLNAKEIYELPSYIFEELIQKGDRLTLYIAQKKYHFPPQLLRTQPKEKFISFVLSRIKTDLNPYWVKYKTIQDQMAHLIHQLDKLSSNITFRNTFWAYGQLKKELAGNRQLTTEGLNQMIQYSNRYPEKAKIWIIFQKEFKLIPAKDMMDHMRSDNNLKFESIDAFMNETSGIAKEKTVPDSVN